MTGSLQLLAGAVVRLHRHRVMSGRQKAEIRDALALLAYRTRTAPRRTALGRSNPSDESHLILAGRIWRHHNDFSLPRVDAEHRHDVLAVGDHHHRAWATPRADCRTRTRSQRVTHGVQ